MFRFPRQSAGSRPVRRAPKEAPVDFNIDLNHATPGRRRKKRQTKVEMRSVQKVRMHR